jgi:hypothetical protein
MELLRICEILRGVGITVRDQAGPASARILQTTATVKPDEARRSAVLPLYLTRKVGRSVCRRGQSAACSAPKPAVHNISSPPSS